MRRLLFCLAVISACTRTDPAPITVGTVGPGALEPNATVTGVVDGDTLRVRVDGRDDRVRLIGIDTPETSPDAPVECYGPEATARIEALVPPGTAIRLERDVEARDRYDRLLAYVFRADDGLFVNVTLVAEGFARTLWIEPNRAYRPEVNAAAGEARAAGRGLWAACPQ